MRSSELMLRFSTTLTQEPPIRACVQVYHNDGNLRLRDRQRQIATSDNHGGPRTGSCPVRLRISCVSRRTCS